MDWEKLEAVSKNLAAGTLHCQLQKTETAPGSSSPRNTGMSEYTKMSGLYLSYPKLTKAYIK